MTREEMSNDTISRQAALDAICKCTDIFINNLQTMVYKADAYKALTNLPSAQPEIIRCKDCIKRDYCRKTNIWAVPPDDDWYCADAERKEE